MAKRFIDADMLNDGCFCEVTNEYQLGWNNALEGAYLAIPTADVVEVEKVSEQIILKKAEVSEYWKNDVKQYRATKGYSDIEHDVDNFLRGYNEAVEDMLMILDERRKGGD